MTAASAAEELQTAGELHAPGGLQAPRGLQAGGAHANFGVSAHG